MPGETGQSGWLFEPEAKQPTVAARACAEVAVPVPIDHAFTYLLPDALARDVTAGSRVLVPFGPRKLLGVVIAVRDVRADEDVTKLKAIVDVVEKEPVLPAELLSFLREVARYYLAPLGEVLALALPAVERKAINRLRATGAATKAPTTKIAPAHLVRWVRPSLLEPPRLGPVASKLYARVREANEIAVPALALEFKNAGNLVRELAAKGFLLVEDRATEVSAFATNEARDQAPVLTEEQTGAVAAIDAALQGTASQAFLLHGVTGSGKTEVYLHAIATALARGRGAMMLVPEIALTPQLVARFRARFGDEVAIVHSALDPAARHAMWRRLHRGELRVAIGARSALFAPVPSLGLVIVDEEHDTSYKQEEGVRYHARDCAILRAHRASAVCVLGSATPSLEVVELARKGKVTTLRLSSRARAQPLPKVEVLDLRHVGAGPTGSKQLSLPLHRALEATLAAGEQAILFLNRRGFAPAVICEACGELRRCPECDVALTLHKKTATRALHDGLSQTIPAGLRCHYCDRLETLPARCPKCDRGPLALEGVGTERLEDVLASAFPKARVGRLDRDVASGKEVEAILKRMRAREIDILVGTQMVTKGHDLPHVTLVGVINADGALSMPDFRASERTFQLLVQVAGRAGRGDAKGTVIIQTRSPDHPAIACAAHHDVDAFLERELRDREELGYPPYSRLILVRLDAVEESLVQSSAARLADVAASCPEVKDERVEIRGPTPAPVPRIRNRYRYRLLLRGQRAELRNVARAIKASLAEISHKVRVVIDVDPLSMM